MKVFISGGAGFIGSNLAKFHLDKGEDVFVYDNLSRKGTEINIKWLKEISKKNKNLKFVNGDIRNIQDIKKYIKNSDIIYHMAAQVAVTTSLTDPMTDFEINALGTFNMLEAYRLKAPEAKFVYASTNKVYGDLEKIIFPKKGISENQNLDFHSPYGCSKGAGDEYVRDYGRVYKLKTIVFRQSCIYGPRQFGNEDQGWVMHFVRTLLSTNKLNIYGDGYQVRDLLHVSDLIDAYQLALKKVKKGEGLVYNIGGGIENSTSLLEVVSLLENKLGKKISLSFSDWREGDQKIYISNNSLISKDLKWKPKINVDHGIDSLIEWKRTRLNVTIEGMRRYIERAKSIAFSATAKDTSFLFVGSWMSALSGLFFTVILARAVSVAELGIFSAAVNLVNILTSLSDIGISSGSIKFVAEHEAKKDHQKVNEYIKAAFVIRIIIVLSLSLVVVLLSKFIAPKLLATTDFKIAIWTAIIPIFLFPDMFFPPILQAKRKFLQSTIVDNLFYVGRLGFALIFFFLGKLNMSLAFWSFGIGFILEMALIIYYLKIDFLFAKPKPKEYQDLLKFSGWLGVNRIISSISGKLDIQMLANKSGAVITGIYSIASRISSFIIVLTSSYSAVLAPRLAAFGDREQEKKYIIKSTLALIPISIAIIFGIFIANPIIIFFFSSKYESSLLVFRYLALAQIPFVFTAPSVTAIVYSMKKTIYIGTFSFFQLAAIFLLNDYLIPKFGPFGPTVTYAVINTILAVFTWVIVIKHYWFEK